MIRLIRNITNYAGRHKKLLLFLMLIIFVLLILLFSEYGFVKEFKLKKHQNEMSEEIQQQLKLKDSLEKRIKLVSFDTNEIEKIARFNYGMIKPKEKVFVIRKNK